MPTRYCRHIKTNGRRCLSPAMRERALCYFHHQANARSRTLTAPSVPPDNADAAAIIHPLNVDVGQLQREPIVAEYFGLAPLAPANATLALPTLEDRESIQMALSLSVQALAENRIDPKRAYTLLFGLQVASRNAENLDLASSEHVVLDSIADAAGHELAPDEDPIEITEAEAKQADWEQFCRDAEEDEDEDDEVDDEEEEDACRRMLKVASMS